MDDRNMKDSEQLARQVETATAALRDRVREFLASVSGRNHVRVTSALSWFVARELPMLGIHLQWREPTPNYRGLVDAVRQIEGPTKKSNAAGQSGIVAG